MAVAATVRVAATGMVAAVRTIPVRVSVIAVIAMAIIAVAMRMVSVAVSVDRRTRARYHHDWRGVTKNNPRKWWQWKANTDVDTCLGSRSRSEKNRREHC